MSATPVVCLALPTLFDAVVARFETDCTVADVLFGWRKPQRHKESRARVAWVPGDPSGSVGNIDPPVKSGDKPDQRSLATLRELFTIYIEADDDQFPEDERSQYVATRLLWDAVYRAMYLAAHGTFRITSLDWNTDKNERRHGAELIAIGWIEAVIPDAPHTIVEPPVDAEITTSLDDVDEVTTTATP